MQMRSTRDTRSPEQSRDVTMTRLDRVRRNQCHRNYLASTVKPTLKIETHRTVYFRTVKFFDKYFLFEHSVAMF